MWYFFLPILAGQQAEREREDTGAALSGLRLLLATLDPAAGRLKMFTFLTSKQVRLLHFGFDTRSQIRKI